MGEHYLSEFERKAWESRDKSTQHKPELALKAALDDMPKIDEGDTIIQAIVVIVSRSEDSSEAVTSYIAGELGTMACMGALSRASRQLDRFTD